MSVYLYFLCAFCSVYQASQWNWFKNGLLAIGTSLITTLCVNIVICVFRTLGIYFNVKYLYNISLYLNK